MKEEQLMKKVKDILTQEEKLRIPIAQGLPWTIDEPEVIPFSYVILDVFSLSNLLV